MHIGRKAGLPVRFRGKPFFPLLAFSEERTLLRRGALFLLTSASKQRARVSGLAALSPGGALLHRRAHAAILNNLFGCATRLFGGDRIGFAAIVYDDGRWCGRRIARVSCWCIFLFLLPFWLGLFNGTSRFFFFLVSKFILSSCPCLFGTLLIHITRNGARGIYNFIKIFH